MTTRRQKGSVFRTLERLADPFRLAAHLTFPSRAAARTARTILT
jgi:hypothetical protein